MTTQHFSARFGAGPSGGPSAAFVLLGLLFTLLWLAGGASRADVAGQMVTRVGAWTILIAALLMCPVPEWRPARGPVVILFLAIVLAAFQLASLPPSLWLSLPGRAVFAEAATASGQLQPWRPLAITPADAANALGSLIVPATVLGLAAGLHGRELRALCVIALAFVILAMMAGLLQAAGAGFDNPLINETRGEVSGVFANRNHFAVLLAMGCLLAPAWAFDRRQPAGWRAPFALGLILVFALTILITGSRAGMGLGVLAIGLGAWLSREGIGRGLRRMPHWAGPVLLIAALLAILGFVTLAVLAGRAESINRALELDAGEDMRRRALPTIWIMIRAYFPAGSGLGGFDPLFRLHEPFALLKPTYFNHAHNDFLEIVLQAGAPGLGLLIAAIAWWAWRSRHAWRGRAMLPRVGSAMILLVLIASAFDYPVRTPTIMAMVVVAAVWLGVGDAVIYDESGNRDRTIQRSPLPQTERHR